MKVKFKNSIGFKFAASLVASIVIVSLISIIVVYFNSKSNLEDQIVNRGNSLLNSYIVNSHDSIAKGQRKTFQRVMDSMAAVEGVEKTTLFARSHMLTYQSGFKTVGIPFLKNSDGTIKNPNDKLYKETNGAYLRSDYSITDHHQSKKVQPHLQKMQGRSCMECHITLDETIIFKDARAVKIGDEKSEFYYDIPVIHECIACHSNWKEGESGGILGLTLSNKNDIEDMHAKIIDIALILLVVGIVISIISIFLTKIIVNYLNILGDGVRDLIEAKGSKIVIKTNDEIGEIANLFNKYIHSIEDGLLEDAKVIDDAKQTTQRISEGHFDRKIEKSAHNKSLNELKELINNMIDKLRASIGSDVNEILTVLHKYQNLDFKAKVDDPNGEIEKSINELSLYISKMLSESKQNGEILDISAKTLKENVRTLTTSANTQAASLEETSASLEEMTANVKQNTSKTIHMEDLANTLQEAVRMGNALANETASSMEEIDHSTQEINNAITVIDKIAFQTNILSLNAAVEAATAGEAGKGFAVVAGEVRNLASRSAEAAKEIKELVDKARIEASQGKQKSSNMIDGYAQIQSKIGETLELITDVASSSKEQLSGIELINNAVAQLDTTTQQNASITQKTDQIASEVQELSQKLVDDANSKNFDHH
jgi:methyl-accepting chemotaxis protein